MVAQGCKRPKLGLVLGIKSVSILVQKSVLSRITDSSQPLLDALPRLASMADPVSGEAQTLEEARSV
jgi:hypothetical protein